VGEGGNEEEGLKPEVVAQLSVAMLDSTFE